MGACFDSATLASNINLDKWFREAQGDARSEFGYDSYNGTISTVDGITVINKTFSSRVEADEWLSNNLSKREGGAVKVLVSENPNAKDEAKLKELAENVAALNRAIYNFPTEILERVKAGNSKFKACKKCESKIAVSHLRQHTCPVCHNAFLYTETDVKKLEGLRSKQEKAVKLHQETSKAIALKNQTKEWVWVVGWWAAC